MKSNKLIKHISLYTLLCGGLLIPFSANAVIFSAIVAFYKILLGEAHALAVSVKQLAISANQIVRTSNQSNKTLTEAINVIEQSQRLAKVMVNYSPKTGQPLSTQCTAMGETKFILAKQKISNEQTILDMKNYASNITSSSSKNIEQELQNVHANYCSEQEQKSGICKDSSKNIKLSDVDFASNFALDNLDKEQVKAAKAYTQKVIQPRIDIASQCKTTNCKFSSNEELQSNAFLSMAANSLNGQINQKYVEIHANAKP